MCVFVCLFLHSIVLICYPIYCCFIKLYLYKIIGNVQYKCQEAHNVLFTEHAAVLNCLKPARNGEKYLIYWSVDRFLSKQHQNLLWSTGETILYLLKNRWKLLRLLHDCIHYISWMWQNKQQFLWLYCMLKSRGRIWTMCLNAPSHRAIPHFSLLSHKTS